MHSIQMHSGPALSLVDGRLDPERDVVGTAGHVTLTLPAGLTAALLSRVPAVFHAGINDVLLTGLALGVADWCRRHRRGRKEQAVLLDLDGHGREEIAEAVRAQTATLAYYPTTRQFSNRPAAQLAAKLAQLSENFVQHLFL